MRELLSRLFAKHAFEEVEYLKSRVKELVCESYNLKLINMGLQKINLEE